MTTSLTKTDKANCNQKTDKVIELKQVGKKYPFVKQADRNITNDISGFWALKDITLDVERGKILGIIGRNGAGKTTLLNIISGVISSTTGEVCIRGRILGLFNLGVGFQDELTGRENIFLNGAIMGASRAELEEKLNSIIEFCELGKFIDMPLGTYSQGMRLRLGFSVIANLDFGILVIDEVLAVGDILFQNKCFQRLMDFKRAGKTLVITSQSMDLIERLCDKMVLLDHGKLLFQGNVTEGTNKYKALLNTEEFFVGPATDNNNGVLVENTKKWADDISNWGKELGTKEVIIDRVGLINRFGLHCSQVKSEQPLKIKVHFTAKNNIREPHFGVAIFRNDGVYCYGPNTEFDGYEISGLRQGKGHFVLNFPKVLLAPGEYRISVAIWDKNETVAFNYREGYYRLTVLGNHNTANELLNIPFFSCGDQKAFRGDSPDLNWLSDKWGTKIDSDLITIESLKLLNNLGEEKTAFMTNEPVNLIVNLNMSNDIDKNYKIWAGIYRDDGVYCLGLMQAFNRNKSFRVVFPKLPLLPGGYRISLGIFDIQAYKFIMCHHAVYPFKMVFNRKDHGTIFLKHTWKWKDTK